MNKLDYILKRVFNYFELNPETAFMKTRKSEIVKARQYFYFYAKKLTDFSYTYISGYLHQDHATALHSIRKINGFIKIRYSPELQIISDLNNLFKVLNLEKLFDVIDVNAKELSKMSDKALLRIERNIKLIKFMRENEFK